MGDLGQHWLKGSIALDFSCWQIFVGGRERVKRALSSGTIFGI